MQRTNRAIRLNDQEWNSFRSLLGMEWLRKQIVKAEKKANSPTVHKPLTKE